MRVPRNKADLLAEYYGAVYSQAQKTGLQGLGGNMADSSLLRELRKHKSEKILELGAGSGEFTQKAMESLDYRRYVATDLMPSRANPTLAKRLQPGRQKKKGGALLSLFRQTRKVFRSREVLSIWFFPPVYLRT